MNSFGSGCFPQGAYPYTTAGHLLVVTGYKIEDNQTTIYINDPNVPGVEVTMTLANFLAVYRMVSYVIE